MKVVSYKDSSGLENFEIAHNTNAGETSYSNNLESASAGTGDSYETKVNVKVLTAGDTFYEFSSGAYT